MRLQCQIQFLAPKHFLRALFRCGCQCRCERLPPSIHQVTRLLCDCESLTQGFLGPQTCHPPKKTLQFVLATENRKRLRICLRTSLGVYLVVCLVLAGGVRPPPRGAHWKSLLRVLVFAGCLRRCASCLRYCMVWHTMYNGRSCLSGVPFCV